MTERHHLSIGEVLSLLRDEFPDVTISKIRFLESQGLLDPERTPSGYRKFYDEDIERLRWILRQQREHFLPLKVIKGRLSESGPEGDADLSRADLSGAAPVGAAPERAEPVGAAPGGAERAASGGPAVAAEHSGGARSGPGLARAGANGGHRGATGPAGSEVAEQVPLAMALGEARGASTAAGAADVVDAAWVADPAARPAVPAGPDVPGAGRAADPGAGDEAGGAASRSPAPRSTDAGRPRSPSRAAGRPARSAAGGGAGAAGTGVPSAAPAMSAVATSGPGPGPAAAPGDAAGPPTGSAGRGSTAGPGASAEGGAEPGDGAMSMTIEELAGSAGVEVEVARDLARYGLIAGRDIGGTDYFDADALVVMRLAAAFSQHGVEARHLRMYKNAAERETGLYEQIVMPLFKQRNPQARQQAMTTVAELSVLGAELRDVLLRAALRAAF